jgi:hypothetical protein
MTAKMKQAGNSSRFSAAHLPVRGEKYSFGKIGHHDEDAPQHNEHSKPERSGPYYQTHARSSMRFAFA